MTAVSRKSSYWILTGHVVTWKSYANIPTGKLNKNGSPQKKISLVVKPTAPGELFSTLLEKLGVYPLHHFMNKWQREQCENLIDMLPLGHTALIRDFSEDFELTSQEEIQSEHWSKLKVSLHVNVLYRHASYELHGNDSTIESPCIVKEHLFSIIDYPLHDHNATHHDKSVVLKLCSE